MSGKQNCGSRNADWGFNGKNPITLGMLIVGMVALLIVMAICLKQADQIERLRGRISAVETVVRHPGTSRVVQAKAFILCDEMGMPCGELAVRDGRPILNLYGYGLSRVTLTAGEDAASLYLQNATGQTSVTLESRTDQPSLMFDSIGEGFRFFRPFQSSQGR